MKTLVIVPAPWPQKILSGFSFPCKHFRVAPLAKGDLFVTIPGWGA
jgi:hypothetical protein